jgi:excisionase family DNA binding protein
MQIRILNGVIRSAAQGLTILLAIASSVATAEPIPGEESREQPLSPATAPSVLTLEEAARLLRVAPSELAELAHERGVPGRRIGGEWRFSREALLAWLAGTDPREPTDSAPSRAVAGEGAATPGGDDPRADSPMSEAELGSGLGRGPEDDEEERGEVEEGEREQATAGEPPAFKTAEEIFLRRKRLLLDRGQFIVEPSLSYSRGEEDTLRGFEFRIGEFVVNIPQLFREEEETTSLALSVRYGLFDQTELYATGLYRYKKVTERAHHRDLSTTKVFGSVPEGSNHLGRVYLGARRTLFTERSLVPDVVLSVEGGIPISKTSYSVGTGLWLVKSFDPISLFAGVEYRHTFIRRFDDLNLLEPEDIFGVSLGYAFSVNDELTISTAVSGLFSDETNFGPYVIGESDGSPLYADLIMQSDESYGLRLGLTYMFRKGMYVEPNVTIGLSDPGSWMMLGLNVPMAFDWLTGAFGR